MEKKKRKLNFKEKGRKDDREGKAERRRRFGGAGMFYCVPLDGGAARGGGGGGCSLGCSPYGLPKPDARKSLPSKLQM